MTGLDARGGISAGESDDALAHTLANFLHTLALSEAASHWSMTTLCGRLSFQIVEVVVLRRMFQQIRAAITALRPSQPIRC